MTLAGDGRAELPVWAPRVQPDKIRRLYQDDAQGMHDLELMDEVGYGLLARCQSFISAVRAVHGEAPCPRCGALVAHGRSKDEMLRCECGWELIWRDYFATIQHKQLSGAEPVLELFSRYVEAYPRCRTASAKMLAIDTLIHGFHEFLTTGNATRPVAVNLIDLRLGAVIDLLDELAAGPNSTQGVGENRAEWERRVVTARGWGLSRRKE